METVSGTVCLEFTRSENNGYIAEGIREKIDKEEDVYIGSYVSTMCGFMGDCIVGANYTLEQLSEKDGVYICHDFTIYDIPNNYSRKAASESFEIEINDRIVTLYGDLMLYLYCKIELEQFKKFAENYIYVSTSKGKIAFETRFIVTDYKDREDINQFDENGDRIW